MAYKTSIVVQTEKTVERSRDSQGTLINKRLSINTKTDTAAV